MVGSCRNLPVRLGHSVVRLVVLLVVLVGLVLVVLVVDGDKPAGLELLDLGDDLLGGLGKLVPPLVVVPIVLGPLARRLVVFLGRPSRREEG